MVFRSHLKNGARNQTPNARVVMVPHSKRCRDLRVTELSRVGQRLALGANHPSASIRFAVETLASTFVARCCCSGARLSGVGSAIAPGVGARSTPGGVHNGNPASLHQTHGSPGLKVKKENLIGLVTVDPIVGRECRGWVASD